MSLWTGDTKHKKQLVAREMATPSKYVIIKRSTRDSRRDGNGITSTKPCLYTTQK